MKDRGNHDPNAFEVSFRALGELNDFLQRHKRSRKITVRVRGHPSVKDTIESIGIPHCEVNVIVIGDSTVDFRYRIRPGDNIRVYPRHTFRKIFRRKSLLPDIPGDPEFIADSHLGKLARHLRLLGFDTLYKKDFHDREIVALAVEQGRIVLSRDIGLLKNKAVKSGRWIRATQSEQQVHECVKYFCLAGRIRPFRLCRECNGHIRPIAKSEANGHIPQRIIVSRSRFFRCFSCARIYWQGSHYEKLQAFVKKVRS